MIAYRSIPIEILAFSSSFIFSSFFSSFCFPFLFSSSFSLFQFLFIFLHLDCCIFFLQFFFMIVPHVRLKDVVLLFPSPFPESIYPLSLSLSPDLNVLFMKNPKQNKRNKHHLAVCFYIPSSIFFPLLLPLNTQTFSAFQFFLFRSSSFLLCFLSFNFQDILRCFHSQNFRFASFCLEIQSKFCILHLEI